MDRGAGASSGERCPLTPRQRETLLLLCEGLTQQQIADRVGVSRRAVNSTLRAACKRLGVGNTAHAAVLLVRNGWDDEDCDIRPLNDYERDYLERADRTSRWLQRDGMDRLLIDIAQAPDRPARSYRVPKR